MLRPRSRLRSIGLVMLALAAFTTTPGFARDPALRYAGVNLAGAEFNSAKKPGTLYKDYLYPADADYAYFAAQGMNIIRLPFLWERLQPQANGDFDADQLGLLHTAVERAKSHGQKLILDVHNYAKYQGQRIGSDEVPVAAFADLWKRLANEFKGDDAVIFGLMNEPNALTAPAWAAMAQSAIEAIRGTGAGNLILVPGTAYSGAHSWLSAAAGGGTSNGQALLATIRDPSNRIAFEVHQYLDQNSSGTSGQCVSASVGRERLRAFTDWLRSNGKVGFLGEFGVGTDATCLSALDDMLSFIADNGDVWLGWSYWAAGAWWKSDYPFNVQPGKDGSDKAQTPILSRHAKQISD